MRILLLGEFSGVHTALKSGLTALGHQVVVGSDGDGFKGFSADFPLLPYRRRGSYYLGNFASLLMRRHLFRGFDVIQAIHPEILPPLFYRIGIVQKWVLRRTPCLVYYACGTDLSYLRSAASFSYFPYDNVNSEAKKLSRFAHSSFLSHLSALIPAMYSYREGYKKFVKTRTIIPLPATPNECSGPRQVRFSGVRRILFGRTRDEFKGSKYIIAALAHIEKEFLGKVEVKIAHRLPLAEYKCLLNTCDIYVDQCRSYDYGMAAIMALQRGAVVLSGAEDIAQRETFGELSPVINIEPNTGHVIAALRQTLSESEVKFNGRSEAGRAWVYKHHDTQRVAAQFVRQYCRHDA